MAHYVGQSGLFETVGSTVKIGNFKAKEPEGATVRFEDANAFKGKKYLETGANKFGEFVTATSTFQNGLASGQAEYKNEPEEVVHTLRVTTTTEPIDTHPNFRTKIGGDSEKPLHQAEYDEDGAFRKFPLKYLENQGEMKPDNALNAKGDQFNFGDQNRYAGVSSYLNASAIWSRSFATDSSPTLAGLGRISKPTGDAPTPAGRNWLYSGFSASFISPAKGDKTRKVKGRVTQEWRLSGRRGWDSDIYGDQHPEGKQEPVGNAQNPAIIMDGVNLEGNNLA